MAASPTLCLCMIVRNEAHVIARALRSVKRLVDYWVICDTGSNDDTPIVAMNTMSGVPGELHRRPWVNFGHNREEALQLACAKADYVLIMDADMVANVHAPFKHKLTSPSYEIRYEGDVDYTQMMLVSSRHEWRYVGATHEYIDSPTGVTREILPELTLTHFGDGGMRYDKFERDVRLLAAAAEEDPENARTAFYLAQSYCDLGQYAEALEWYEKRATMGGWEEERWYAMYKAAQARHVLGQDWEEVEAAYFRAFDARPWRLEPLFHVVKHYREAAQYETGYRVASFAGLHAPYPEDFLFVEKPLHLLEFPLEFGVCAYGSGRFAEAVDAFNLVMKREPQTRWILDSAIRGRTMALRDLYPPQAPRGQADNHLVVIAPFHNPGEALDACVQSLFSQDYGDFEVLFLDDGSTDDSARFVPVGDPRFRLLRNPERQGLAKNLTRLLGLCRPQDIVVCVDGDDKLARPDALTLVNQAYHQHDCWVAYSQFRAANGAYGFCQPFAHTEDFATLRRYFRTSHLRTFRAGLFHRLAEQDPQYSFLKDDGGEWLTSAVDAALMAPLLEMAGFERVRYIDEVLYEYNDEHPNNVHRLHREQQKANFELVAAKRPLSPVEHYFSEALCES